MHILLLFLLLVISIFLFLILFFLYLYFFFFFFFFSSRRRHTRCLSDWSSDVCSSDLPASGVDRDARSTEGRRPGARLDGPRARARDHHQGAHGAPPLPGARRPDLHAEPHRHAGARRLLDRKSVV